MGARKRISAEARKEAQKTMYFAKLNNVPTSPRKMRLVADMIRGMEVFRALGVLKFSNKEAAARVEKLLPVNTPVHGILQQKLRRDVYLTYCGQEQVSSAYVQI